MWWWIWIIGGFILIGLEVVVPGVALIWFGTGGVIVGILAYFFKLNLILELLLWGGISTLLIGITFRWFYRTKEGERIDLNKKYYSGKKGIVIKKLDPFFGIAQFEEPILGDRKWRVKGEGLEVGDIVEVEDVEGNFFKVRKVGKVEGLTPNQRGGDGLETPK
ncbi:MAG: NfeD family protein [Campylobacterales bacterium]